MDAFTDPEVEEVVLMASAQVGKTDILLNALGYIIHHDPGPVLLMQSTDKLSADFSTDRIDPMIAACPAVKAKFKDKWSRDSDNKILHKKFPGGYLFLTGAKEARNLRSKPVRYVLQDEIDSYDGDVGGEGDPCDLADARTKTYPIGTRKKFKSSTPTEDQQSRIQQAYLKSDRRRFWLPCPHCGEFQVLNFRDNLKWPRDPEGNHLPELAYYVCEHCGCLIDEKDKPAMLLAGEWRAEKPFKGIAGFWINELYSPWSTWAEIAIRFLEVYKDPERHKTFVNTCLGEPWVTKQESLDADNILSRRGTYLAQVPRGGLVLTAGVDVQPDRVEVEIKAWGVGQESWSIDYRIIHGSPEERYVWDTLDLIWEETFTHETGATLLIDAACIDSGYATTFVYDYCRNKKVRRIFCVKGKEGGGMPSLSAPIKKRTGKNRRPVDLYLLGVDGLKTVIYNRLRKPEPGPGYMHFPDKYGEEYFRQLTAEVVQSKYERGFERRVWKKVRHRNEALDCNVYAYAALLILNPSLEQLGQRFAETGKVRAPQPVKQRSYRSRGI
jgi:phage terminase large subunit GpA-like protein